MYSTVGQHSGVWTNSNSSYENDTYSPINYFIVKSDSEILPLYLNIK